MNKTQCIYCRMKPAKLPADFKSRGFSGPLFCSLKCLYHKALQSFMDYRICPKCNQWYNEECICEDNEPW